MPVVLSILALAAGAMSGPARAQDEGFGGAEGAPAPDLEQTPPVAEKKPPPPLETDELYDAVEDSTAEGPSAQDAAKAPASLGGPAPSKEEAPEEADARVRPLTEIPADPPPEGMGNWSASSVQYGAGVCSACACCGTSGVLGGAALAVAIVVPGGVLLTPFVGCLGCSSVVGAPGLGASAAIWLREWLGIWRGPWMIAIGLAYVVELIGVAALLAGVAAAAALLYGFVQSLQGPGVSTGNLFELFNPPEEWAWENAGAGAGLFAGSFAFGLAWAVLAPPLAATVVYQVLGEQKHSYDIGFRVPGFFGPNHAEEPKVHPPDTQGPERARPRPAPEPASMEY